MFRTINNIQSNNYSTDEQVIGKQIDDKPLYQKVIVKTGVLETTNIAHEISNVDTIFIAYMFIHDTNKRFYSAEQFCIDPGKIQVDETYVSINFKSSNQSADNGGVFVLRYTKTTD